MNIGYLYYFYKKHIIIGGILFLIFMISIISIYIYISAGKTSIYTNTQTQYFNIADLHTQSGKLYIEFKGDGYKAISFKVIPDISAKANEKINKFFGGIPNVINGLKQNSKNIEFNYYMSCQDEKCDIKNNFAIYEDIKNKIIDRYLFFQPDNNEMNQDIINMHNAIRQSCFGNDPNYPKQDVCVIKDIELIIKSIKVEMTYHFDDNKTKTKIFNL